MAFLGWFHDELRPDGWWDAELQAPAWFDSEIVDTAAAGGGITGSAAQTLATLTQSAAASNETHGASSVTLGTLTQTAAGSVALSGAAAQTLGSVTNSASGQVPDAGQGDQALGLLTQSATATADITGTTTQTLAELTQVGAGGTATASAGDQTLDALSQTAVGTVGEHTGSTDPVPASSGGPDDEVFDAPYQAYVERVTAQRAVELQQLRAIDSDIDQGAARRSETLAISPAPAYDSAREVASKADAKTPATVSNGRLSDTDPGIQAARQVVERITRSAIQQVSAQHVDDDAMLLLMLALADDD